MTLHHRFNIILIIIKIYTLHSFLIFHKLINIKSVKMQNSEDSQKCSKCSSFHGDIRDFLHVIVIEIERGEYLCHDCLESTLQKQQHEIRRIEEEYICSKEFESSVSESELKVYENNDEDDLNAILLSQIELLEVQHQSISNTLQQSIEQCNQLRQRVYVAEEDEQKFWESVNRLEKKTFKLQQKSLRAKTSKQLLKRNLESLTETSIAHIFFNIQIQDNYSQVCGLTIGKKPDQAEVNWEETNAGISHLLLGYNYLAMKYGIPFTRIEDISIKGTLSEILVRNTSTYVSVCYTKENERIFGLVLDALLFELNDLNQHIQEIEKKIEESEEQLKLPFPINTKEGKILDMYVNPTRLEEKNKWNQWTKGMRYMLIDFKHLLTISSLRDPYL